jgi:aspartate/methionine/tyrosine aminotransferase
MIFSDRTAWDLTENDLTAAVRQARAQGRELLDLTVSNPTVCGFDYDELQLLAPLSHPSAIRYAADPLGMVSAREAVATYYRDHHVAVPVERLCLTTSTTEAYSFLFRLLCNPGDNVLAAQPSYPLFDFIAQLDDVELRSYPLFYDPSGSPASDTGAGSHGWSIDLHALQAAITSRTRAILLVHPNNPTGNFVSPAERLALQQFCADRGLALIVDEVFLDYALEPHPPRSFAGDAPCLTFVLSGLSKICGLPQMKASWLAVSGPAALAQQAMDRIEVIADTFLSMNAPVQHALPLWLAHRGRFQQQVLDRMRENLAVLDARLRGTSAQRLSMQGGWTAVLQIPRTVQGQTFVEAALTRDVLVQPGSFYGLPEGRAVLSLLTPPGIWTRGLAQLPIE